MRASGPLHCRVRRPAAHRASCGFPGVHWMMRSARARSDDGMVSPRAWAVLAVTISSNFCGCSRDKDLVLALIQEAVHHIDVNVSELMMLERLWNGADDRKSQCLPERNGACIRADHEVELHGFVAGVLRLEKAVMPERSARTSALRCRVDHERGICNMGAEIALIRPKLVHAKDP